MSASVAAVAAPVEAALDLGYQHLGDHPAPAPASGQQLLSFELLWRELADLFTKYDPFIRHRE